MKQVFCPRGWPFSKVLQYRNRLSFSLAVVVEGLAVVVEDLAVVVEGLAVVVEGLAVVVEGLAVVVEGLAALQGLIVRRFRLMD